MARHRCGAVYHSDTRIWYLQSGIGFAQFLEALRMRGYVVNDTDDLAQWIETCAAADAPRPNAPGGTC